MMKHTAQRHQVRRRVSPRTSPRTLKQRESGGGSLGNVSLIFIFMVGVYVGTQFSMQRQRTSFDSSSQHSFFLNSLATFTDPPTTFPKANTDKLALAQEDAEVAVYNMLHNVNPPNSIVDFPKTNKTITACLFAMDDSIRLAEWLAYHYTVLPLGALTIAIDPNSENQQRVLEIIDLWRDRIDITAYTDDSQWLNYSWDEGWSRKLTRPDGNLAPWFVEKDNDIYRSQSHKRRQNAFALHCMRKYKKQSDQETAGSTDFRPKWLLMTDSDEFLLYNYIHADEENHTSYALKRGTTKDMINEDRLKKIPLRQRLPTMNRRVTVADWLAVENKKLRCWKFPGLFISSYESSEEERDADVPEGINADHLMTLRFRKAGLRYGNFSKALLDVSWGSLSRYGQLEVQNIHNPHKRICGVNGQSGSNADYLSSAFRINHYSSGTLEAFCERGNDRRVASQNVSFDRFQQRNVDPFYTDDDIRPWIQWFVDKVGRQEAKRLLVDPLEQRYQEFANHPFVLENEENLKESFPTLPSQQSEASDDDLSTNEESNRSAADEGFTKTSSHTSNADIYEMLRVPADEIPEYPKTNKQISACLFAMDDSIRLAEWIAYHYTVLPLGALTIAIDPHSESQQRVLEVLDLWRDKIDIQAYTDDSEWMPWKDDEGWGRKIYRVNGKLAKWLVTKSGPIYRSQAHKRRQNAFALHCMRRYKKQIKEATDSKINFVPSWVLMTDSDEFLLYNYIHADEENEKNYEVKRGTTPEMIDEGRRKMIPLRRRLPPMEHHVTIADWLSVENGLSRCWNFPGLRMSSYESSKKNIYQSVPDGINPYHLQTLRYRHAGLRFGNFSKALLDVSWGKLSQYGKDDVQNIHNPHKRICGVNGHSGSNADYLSSVFRINHYSSGSLEAFVERANDRRVSNQNVSFHRFSSRNADPLYQDDDIRPWIDWFVEKVGGIKEAQRLLVEPLKERYEFFGQHPFVLKHKDKIEAIDQ